MTQAVDTIASRLRNDPTLTGTLSGESYTGILKGGVWTRRLKREPPGETPEAFYVSSRGKIIKPSAVVLDGGEQRHQAVTAIHGAYRQIIRIYLYATATQSGKDAIENAFERIYELLDFSASGWTLGLTATSTGFLVFQGRTGLAESEQFSEAVFDILAFDLIARHTVPEV
jgi:hypothetical protein